MKLMTRKARGVALPVMLIMLAVMLIGSLYLLRSSTSSTLAATNLAYDSSLSRAADGGLMTGFATERRFRSGVLRLVRYDAETIRPGILGRESGLVY
jgi:hypothetical protein